MRHIKSIAAIIGIAVCLSACKKDADNNPPATYDAYLPLKVGNYWIYEDFRIDTLGNATTLTIYDSTFIEKDTAINNQTYFKLTQQGLNGQWRPQPIYIRDSLHYLVNHLGEIVFSSQNFTDTFVAYYHQIDVTNAPDTVAYVTTKMEDKDLPVTAPAGSFTTNSYRTTYNMTPYYTVRDIHRPLNMRYAKNIGVITETLQFYLSDPAYTEKRLVRYHLN